MAYVSEVAVHGEVGLQSLLHLLTECCLPLQVAFLSSRQAPCSECSPHPQQAHPLLCEFVGVQPLISQKTFQARHLQCHRAEPLHWKWRRCWHLLLQSNRLMVVLLLASTVLVPQCDHTRLLLDPQGR